jgi:hypothetical protein
MTRRALLLVPLIAAALLPATPSAAQSQPARPTLDDFSRRLLADVQRAGEDLAGETLAQWIIASRADAVRSGVLPMPEAVRTRLKGQFPEALLARVRYRVGSANEFSLASNAFKNRAAAITLDDVVLFRSSADAQGDARLWAHELTHVLQYERWGIRGFARRYTLDHRGVEAEATAREQAFAASAKTVAPASGPSSAGTR